MKKILCTFILSALFLSGAVCKSGDILYVGIKEKALKASTGFFAKVTATVYYGDVVVVVSEKGSWTEVSVQSSSKRGWIPTSSLTKKKIIAGKTVSTSAAEISLAGKGFSPEAEAAFKNKNPNKRYDLVDSIEKIAPNESEVKAFITEGKLNGGE